MFRTRWRGRRCGRARHSRLCRIPPWQRAPGKARGRSRTCRPASPSRGHPSLPSPCGAPCRSQPPCRVWPRSAHKE
eukprot:2321585-Heterocapsa_arctica.AAC.1